MLGFSWINTKTPLRAFLCFTSIYTNIIQRKVFLNITQNAAATFFPFNWQFLDLFDMQVFSLHSLFLLG